MSNHVNVITALLAALFAIPVLAGMISPLNGSKIHRSVAGLLNSLIMLAALVLSIYLTRLLFSGDGNAVLTYLYKIVPALQVAVADKAIWVYALFMAALLFIVYCVLYLLTTPIYKYAVVPISNKISASINSMGNASRRILSGVWQLPRSVMLVLVFSLLVNFYTRAYSASPLAVDANNSAPYQLIQENVIQPLLNNSVVKNIQVLLNDSFKKAKDELTDARQSRLTIYFNGVTLDEAIQSNSDIDTTAKKIVGSATDDKKKASLIYKWICKNVKYDYDKAAVIAKNPSGVSSGAIVAYGTKKGVCFDYACLYVAMCRAVNLKVRFITGSGYSGTAWGDHAWNQVYDSKAADWINVDTTFGSTGVDYFGRTDFDADHADGVIQGEW
jgi:hypothetical protein